MSSPALKSKPDDQAAPKPALVPPASTAPAGAARPNLRRRIILGAVLLVALGTAAKFGYEWWTVGRFTVSTDDAYVKADTSVLSTKIAGLVTQTPVLNNTQVKAGDVILKLDDTDYQLAVAAAKAKIETQTAAIAAIGQQKTAQAAQIAAADAQVASAKAVELNAALTQQRASQMVKTNAGSQQALDDANRARDTAAAGVTVADSNLAAAKAQLGILDANEKQAQSTLNEINVALQKAEHDLTFAEIKAPFDGVVANRAVAPGEYVQPGANLMALVPVTQSFITANFKETQLSDLRPGQKVEITVDSYKGQTFEGKVASLSPASGAEFSLLPPDNATGNFTKIIQRFPVKILVAPEISAKLRPGMSVAVSIDTRDKGAEQ
ncbi:MAG: HlyD family secretion protein [Alphaproteobacteria bacterium]|nr:HlyD family secretion protein [Alphaproteobacteria bacterium]